MGRKFGLRLRNAYLLCSRENRYSESPSQVHTIDINDFYSTEEMTFNFQTVSVCIAEGSEGYFMQADSAAFYHQLPLPAESKKFYAFDSPIGRLTLTTLPTGQRHTVGVAQTISSILLRIVADRVPEVKQGIPVAHTAYIDNYRMCSNSVESTKILASVFMDTAAEFKITMNETLDEIVEAITAPVQEFRGMAFHRDSTTNAVTVGLAKKSKDKLEQLLHVHLPKIAVWSVELLESAVSFLIFCSSVLQVQLCSFYHIFKLLRRRLNNDKTHRQKRRQHARVWPSVIESLTSWIKELLDKKPVDYKKMSDASKLKVPIVVTDASLTGWGAMMFFDGKVSWTGGSWPIYLRRACIAELEAHAVLNGLSTLLPNGGFVHVIIDNTSVQGALRKGYSRNFFINKVITKVQKIYTIIRISYIKSEDNPTDPMTHGRAPDMIGRRATAMALLAEHHTEWLNYV